MFFVPWWFTLPPMQGQPDRGSRVKEHGRNQDSSNVSFRLIIDGKVAGGVASTPEAMHQQYQSALANASSSFWKMGVMHSWTLRQSSWELGTTCCLLLARVCLLHCLLAFVGLACLFVFLACWLA